MKKYRVIVGMNAAFTTVVEAHNPQEAVEIVEKTTDPSREKIDGTDAVYTDFIVDPCDNAGRPLEDDPEYDTRILTPEFRRERASGKMLEVLKTVLNLYLNEDDPDQASIVQQVKEVIAEAEGSGS